MTIRARKIIVSESKESSVSPAGPYLRVTVSDNGPAMKKEMLERVFDPFFTAGEFGTWDLDLAAAYGIIGQSGGHLSALSHPDKGNTFVVHIPMRAA